jgi:hypothetical protein
MPGLLPDIDPEGLLEFSVVFTDRSLNRVAAPTPWKRWPGSSPPARSA